MRLVGVAQSRWSCGFIQLVIQSPRNLFNICRENSYRAWQKLNRRRPFCRKWGFFSRQYPQSDFLDFRKHQTINDSLDRESTRQHVLTSGERRSGFRDCVAQDETSRGTRCQTNRCRGREGRTITGGHARQLARQRPSPPFSAPFSRGVADDEPALNGYRLGLRSGQRSSSSRCPQHRSSAAASWR
jgi:hypothetical protein